MNILRGATVPLEVAHRGLDGRMHGHSLTAEVWTETEIDLDDWRGRIACAVAEIDGELEISIQGRTFEDVAIALLTRLPEASRVMVRLPTRGHAVEVWR